MDDRIGSYRVEAEMGPTGWGTLLQARHVVLPRRVIIKVVRPAFAAMPPYMLQTLREACILEAIAHPGVPVVYESGVLADRRPWFAFEWISGPTLEDLLADGAMPATEVGALLRDLVDIAEHAHRRGVIHCALRPDRVLITSERRYPLCIPDWSEAIAHDATSRAPLVGQEEPCSYRAPELPRRDGAGESVDDRADMFALGVIAYRALTGGLPFVPGDDVAPHVAVRERCPDVPPELAAIIDALLARDRSDRPGAAEVRASLDDLLETLPELALGAEGRRAPRLAIVRDVPDVAASPRGDAGGLPQVAQRQPKLVVVEPRLRRPRWTPAVHYVELPHGEIKPAEDDHAE